MGTELTVITACYNDYGNLESTLVSLKTELVQGDEVIVVDSSVDRDRVDGIVEQLGLKSLCRHIWLPPRGVYSAQNRGILEARRTWVQVLNSGDELLPHARAEIDRAIGRNPDVMIHVFRQNIIDAGGPSYTFSPTYRSVWPHQSIIANRTVYEREGLYPENYHYVAEQIYFAHVRNRCTPRLHLPIITTYLSGGLSARIDARHLREAYDVRRALGQTLLRSIVCGWASPVLRRVFEKTFGMNFVNRLKARLFHYYRPVSYDLD